MKKQLDAILAEILKLKSSKIIWIVLWQQMRLEYPSCRGSHFYLGLL
jgi:hypothetical protein